MSEFINQNLTGELIAAVRQGDDHKYRDLTEPYRRELQVHCYRILGSLYEAEDLVQETFLRAWLHIDAYQGRGSFRAWLYKIATNACLDYLDRTRYRRSLPTSTHPASDPHAPILPPAAELSWLQPFPDEWLVDTAADPAARYSAYESVSLAFLTALQALPPRQRAVLILSDVLDWSSREIAELLGVTVSAVSSALYRARTTLATNYHGAEPDSLQHLVTDERTRGLLELYQQAWESADVVGLVALLKEDATFAMPPSPSWYRGREAIGVFLATTVFADGGLFVGAAAGRWRLLPCRANAQPAFSVYERLDGNLYQAFGMHLLASQDAQLAQITSFIDPSLPVHFGLQPVRNR